MPVRVECDVKPSQLQHLYSALPVLLGVSLTLVFNLSLWWTIVWLPVWYAGWHHQRTQWHPEHVRMEGADLVFWIADDAYRCRWQGEGRCSHTFIQWALVDDQAQPLTLRIWKDSVSEPSWRALNMGYRVNRPDAIASATER